MQFLNGPNYETLRGPLSGYQIPAPFVVKSEEIYIVFNSDENNWGLPGYFEEGVDGNWQFRFNVIFPSTATVSVDATTEPLTTETTTVTPNGLSYTVNTSKY